MRVLVAGGSGFVGGAIRRELAWAGMDAVAASRSAVPGALVCDATDARALERALEGMDAVVNAVLAPGAAMLVASRQLALAASRRGLVLVHLSSMAVYGAATGLTDEAAPLLAVSRYGRAKTACERVVRAAAPDAVILRPGIVYGPGSEAWIARPARLLRARRLGDLGEAGDGRCNLVHASDVGRAVVSALQRNAARGQSFNLAMPEPPRWNEFLLRLARATGATPLSRIGGGRLRLEAMMAPALLAARRFARVPDGISGGLLRLFAQDITLDGRCAERLLGLVHTPFDLGMEQSAAWLSGGGG